jgi:hypothetical protein
LAAIFVPSIAITPTRTNPASSQEGEDPGEELSQGRLVTATKLGDRRVIGDVVGTDHPVGDVLLASALDPTRGAVALA